MAPFRAERDERLAHAVHLLALARTSDTSALGYRREDAALRRGARQPPPELSPAVLPSNLEAAAHLAAGRQDLPDHAWFAQRWALGEGEACSTHAQRVAAEANGFDHGGMLGNRTRSVIVCLSQGDPPAVLRDGRLVVGPRATGAGCVVAIVAQALEQQAAFAAIEEVADRRLMAWHSAVTAVLRARDQEEADDALVRGLASTSLPPVGEQEAAEARVRALAVAYLDQPPGEIERIAIGLARRRLPRLRRAWRRGFFVPPALDLKAWVGARRQDAHPGVSKAL